MTATLEGALDEGAVPRCRAWPLVVKPGRLTAAERDAGDLHLTLCRRCRTTLDTMARARRNAVGGTAAVAAGTAATAIASATGGAATTGTTAAATATAVGAPAVVGAVIGTALAAVTAGGVVAAVVRTHDGGVRPVSVPVVHAPATGTGAPVVTPAARATTGRSDTRNVAPATAAVAATATTTPVPATPSPTAIRLPGLDVVGGVTAQPLPVQPTLPVLMSPSLSADGLLGVGGVVPTVSVAPSVATSIVPLVP